MTFWILLTLASILSYLSLRYINILLSLGASMGWLTLMGYNLTNPPTNITVGSVLHEWLTLVFVIVAIAVMYMWFRNRARAQISARISHEGGESEGEVNVTAEMQSEDIEAYRRRVRRALHPRRRR